MKFEIAPGQREAGTLRSLSGSVYMPSARLLDQLGIGWAREGFYWSQIEPDKDHWNWKPFDQMLLAAKGEGVQILPLLAYNAPWDESVAGNGFSPPARVEDWEDFIEHVVARYSAPPFNLRYFQIWNEPTRQAGFWTGTDQEFIDEVYLPAAKIIRRHHCNVVFGGWPASNSVQEFDSVLEYHEAWKWTDILDVHYEGLPYFKYLYNRWVKPGKCKGIWETELGFSDDPDFIPSVYLPILHWALEHGWNEPNQYKLFWYAAWGAGPDGPKCLSQTDAKGQVVLSDQGKRLAVLNTLLGGGSLKAFSEYSITPLPPDSTVMGFKNGDRIVVALLLNKSGMASNRFVSVRIPFLEKPAKVGLEDENGFSVRFAPRFHRGFLVAKIPLRSLAQESNKTAIGYLEVDPAVMKN